MNQLKFTGLALFFAILLPVGSAFAQTNERDPKAKQVLDQVREKSKSYQNVVIEFTYRMQNEAEGMDESQAGTVKLKGDNYWLSVAGQVIVSDGKALYTIIDDVDLAINKIPKDGEAVINPKLLMDVNADEYKYQHMGDKTIDGVPCHHLKLFPEDANAKPFHRVELYIDKTKMQPKQVVIYSKDGNLYTLIIRKFTPNSDVPDTLFQINPADYDDVNDLR